MKFSIGDLILLKRTGEEGRVVAFLSDAMMEVEVGGINFPVYNEEVDHPYLKWFTEKKKERPKTPQEIPVEKPAARIRRLATGIYLSFMPQFEPGIEDVIEAFKIHFINETPDPVLFSYYVKDAAGSSLFQHKASLHAFGHIYLHPLSLEEMNAQPRFHWEVGIAGKNQDASHGVLRIRPAQLIRFIREMFEENQPGFSVLLSTEANQSGFPEEQSAALSLLSIGAMGPKALNTKIFLGTSADPVVDLHMRGILADGTQLSPEEILQTQLNYLRQKIQAAMAAGLTQIIIIHGLGKGTLRRKVHELLADTKRVSTFSNHWMSGYGWGATAVIFDA